MMIVKSVVVWLIFILAESLNGSVRHLWLIPWVGDRLGHQISFGIGSILIVAIAMRFIRWLKAERVAQQLAVGLLWLLLTLGFEFGLGHFVLGYSWERIAADYNLAQGRLMSIGLVLVTVAPLLATKLVSKSAIHLEQN